MKSILAKEIKDNKESGSAIFISSFPTLLPPLLQNKQRDIKNRFLWILVKNASLVRPPSSVPDNPDCPWCWWERHREGRLYVTLCLPVVSSSPGGQQCRSLVSRSPPGPLGHGTSRLYSIKYSSTNKERYEMCLYDMYTAFKHDIPTTDRFAE